MRSYSRAQRVAATRLRRPAAATSRAAASGSSRPSSAPPIPGDVLGVVPAADFRRLRLTSVPGFLKDRRDVGIGDEALPALGIPVEERPDPVLLIGIAKDGRTLRPVLLSLL